MNTLFRSFLFAAGCLAAAASCTDDTTGGGWLVRTQKNRGEFYQNFCLRLLETRNCAGWMHFEYNDGYGGTADSNKGLVSVEYTPYADYLNLARELHTNLYPLASYYDAER